MSQLRFMERLLEGVEVEWKKLGICSLIKRGQRVTKNELAPEKEYPVYSGGVTPMGYFEKFNQNSNTITVTKYGTAGFVNFITEEFWANDVCYCISPYEHLNNKYLFYFLKNLQDYIQSKVTNAIPAHLPTEVISNIQIPIPPLEVQSEIVRILDNFTELTAELTAELSARKKQYHYYRDQLLSFEEGEVEWKSLGEVVIIKNGKDWKKLNNGNIPVYGSGGVMAYVDKSSYDKVSVLIPRKGTITNIFYTEEPFWNVDTIFYTEINESILVPKYFYYFMSNFNLENLSTDSTRPSLTQTILKKIKIPIPPLEKQKEIVTILDKFDTLTHSISEGLPKEIDLRQKQYEYYRNLLLSFPKKEVEA